MLSRCPRLPVAAGLSLIFCLAVASAAQAGVLVSSATSCDAEALSQPFVPWLDSNQYTPVPGGTFESGATPWSLSGGAAVVAGNETYYVDGASDSQSLSLPAGSSATSPAMCIGVSEPTLRLFVRNSGSFLSSLRVDVLFDSASGQLVSLPIAVLPGGATWQPTAPILVLANLLSLLPNASTPVQFRFTPLGAGGGWQIDDAYVDPWRRS